MRKRSKAREYALQMLYQADIRHLSAEAIQTTCWEAQTPDDDMRAFADQLVNGTLEHLEQIDGLIKSHAQHWDLKRMAVIDRNILRLGAFELLYLDDVPPKVCINEAVELAKRFGDAESSKFVNGILDAIHKAAPREEVHE